MDLTRANPPEATNCRAADRGAQKACDTTLAGGSRVGLQGDCMFQHIQSKRRVTAGESHAFLNSPGPQRKL